MHRPARVDGRGDVRRLGPELRSSASDRPSLAQGSSSTRDHVAAEGSPLQCVREPAVRGHQGAAEGHGQGDVHRVVDRPFGEGRDVESSLEQGRRRMSREWRHEEGARDPARFARRQLASAPTSSRGCSQSRRAAGRVRGGDSPAQAPEERPPSGSPARTTSGRRWRRRHRRSSPAILFSASCRCRSEGRPFSARRIRVLGRHHVRAGGHRRGQDVRRQEGVVEVSVDGMVSRESARAASSA